jgi:hypothetical protein
VPNFGSPEARLTKGGWFHLDVPRHLSHHTRPSLEGALQGAGLQSVWFSTMAPEYDCFSLVQSLLNWLGVRQNYLYNRLRSRKAKVTTGRSAPVSFFITLVLAPLFGLLSAPATMVLGLLGQGAALTIYALKTGPSDGKKT